MWLFDETAPSRSLYDRDLISIRGTLREIGLTTRAEFHIGRGPGMFAAGETTPR